MTAILLDTNAFAWALQGTAQLTPSARSAISTATTVHPCPISIFEIAQKVRIGKWPAMAAIMPHLASYVYLQGIAMVPLDASICAVTGSMTWSRRDPFDRIIAATALHLGCPLISSDAAFNGIVARIW